MDRWLLFASTICLLGGCAYTAFAFRRGIARPPAWNLSVNAVAFALQTIFLHQRGQAIGRCPLTNLFEVLIFLSWSMLLLYFVVGPAFRLSLLGAFTAPLVGVLQAVALIAPIDRPARVVAKGNAWLELHAALSIIAYGAFALACVAGAMYLIQERQLKRHKIRPLFYELPPIAHLAGAIRRLVGTGFVLLTAGLIAGFLVGKAPGTVTAIWAVAVWLGYGSLFVAQLAHRLSPRRVAWLAILGFALTLSSLWGLHFVSGKI